MTNLDMEIRLKKIKEQIKAIEQRIEVLEQKPMLDKHKAENEAE
jgi:hypothetical protein